MTVDSKYARAFGLLSVLSLDTPLDDPVEAARQILKEVKAERELAVKAEARVKELEQECEGYANTLEDIDGEHTKLQQRIDSFLEYWEGCPVSHKDILVRANGIAILKGEADG